MSKTIKLKKGLDIKLVGAAEMRIATAPMSENYAVIPDNFEGVTPKLLVKEGDSVLAGAPLFFSKLNPQIIFTSPVSGVVEAVVRGDKRKLMAIVVKPETEQHYKQFETAGYASLERARIVELMLEAGLWPMLIQRPYGIIANQEDTPRDIFVSGFDSAPIAPELQFALKGQQVALQAGFDILKKLTNGDVYLGLNADQENTELEKITGVQKRYFKGKHPIGNVGVQIHHIKAVNKGEVVWTIDLQNLAILGRFFMSGQVNMTKTIALAGSEVSVAQYFNVIHGAQIGSILRKSNITPQNDGDLVRVINGNPLTGTPTTLDGYLDFYTNSVSVIPEGNKHEFLGWFAPRFDKFSVSRSYFSWLMPRREYNLDTNLNGGHRAFVLTGLYDKYLPMDIYPLYLLKAIIAKDIDKMENLGIYEVVPEDFALCEFVDPSKTEMQEIVREGIRLMINELN